MIATVCGTRTLPLLGALACFILFTAVPASGDELEEAFLNPPPAARPWVFWYWDKGAISREGITRDLEAMHAAGLGGAYLMTIKGGDPKLWDPPVAQLTPEWWDMIRHAFAEANRLKLELAMHDCDGFATAGGPWITPEKSMQKVVWSETYVTGGLKFTGKLPQPSANEDFYRDIGVFAYPVASVPPREQPTITTSTREEAQFLANPKNEQRIRFDKPGWIQYEYAKPFECRTITVVPDGNSFQANRLKVCVSDDGKNFRELLRLEPPRHGWQNGTSTVTHAIPPTTAKYFRFDYHPEDSEPGAEDLDSAKWKPSLKVRSITLSGTPRLHQFESKNGEYWRVSRRTTTEQLPDVDCVPAEKFIDISEHLQSDGTLDWQVPDGNWCILRMGHTSTGTYNETGGAGRGLECDKFDPEVVRFHFDHWFGEIIRQVGPELANDVLKIFHVDSWECGSQNWSPAFLAEFQKRRGYDLRPWLPVMAGVPINSADQSERILFDVRQTISELLADSFFATMAELAHEQGCQFSAECVAPTMVADSMRHFGIVDIPMGEFWFRSPTHDKPNDMRDAISAGHIYGKPIIQAEAFTELRMAWDEHPGMLKALGDSQLALGANRLVYHVFNHNPWLDRRPGMTLDAIGLYFQRDQTWWSTVKAWTDYHARCQALLQLGTPVVDIAVFTGEEVPSRAVLPETLTTTLPGIMGEEAVEREKTRLANVGNPQREMPRGVNHSANVTTSTDWIDPLRGYAYDSINADALLRLAKVENHRIVLPGGASYSHLVLPMPRSISPHPERMTPDLARKLSRLVAEGANIIACVHGRLSPSFVDYPASDEALREMLGDPPSGDALLNETHGPKKQIGDGQLHYGPVQAVLLPGLAPDFVAEDQNGEPMRNIAWNHRRTKDADWYFVSNQADKAQEVKLRLRTFGFPELWDPLTGEILTIPKFIGRNEFTYMPVRLEPHGSLFVVFRKPTDPPYDIPKNWREFETLQQLSSNWTVTFDKANDGPAESVEFPKLTDWSTHADERIHHYSGTAVYRQTFDWSNDSVKRIWLDLGNVANIAEVYVNDIPQGVAWTPPYRVEITKGLKPGKNELAIAVTNTWANRLIGDAKLPVDKRLTWMTAPYPTDDAKLLPAGLLGPVSLVREAEIESQ
jgi:hypothetical protein